MSVADGKEIGLQI